MSNSKPLPPWRPIEVRTSTAVRYYLRELVASGLYGQTIEAAAEEIICAELRKMIADGRLRQVHFSQSYLDRQ